MVALFGGLATTQQIRVLATASTATTAAVHLHDEEQVTAEDDLQFSSCDHIAREKRRGHARVHDCLHGGPRTVFMWRMLHSCLDIDADAVWLGLCILPGHILS